MCPLLILIKLLFDQMWQESIWKCSVCHICSDNVLTAECLLIPCTGMAERKEESPGLESILVFIKFGI